MHIAEQHHRKVFSQHSFRAWVEGTACSKEDAAAQQRKQETWNKVQGWLAESNLGKMSSAQPSHETASSPVRHAASYRCSLPRYIAMCYRAMLAEFYCTL